VESREDDVDREKEQQQQAELAKLEDNDQGAAAERGECAGCVSPCCVSPCCMSPCLFLHAVPSCCNVEQWFTWEGPTSGVIALAVACRHTHSLSLCFAFVMEVSCSQ
jgi:hypothetical protein